MNHDRILLDIETQRDFFVQGGSCYDSTRSTAAAKNIYKLFDWARKYKVPVMSTVLRVRPNERGPIADVPHCVEGTDGEKKLSRTVLPSRINLGLRNTTDLPRDLFETYQQVIFEKRNTDLLAHARAERLLTEMEHATFVICGAGVARPIFEAAIGLRNRGFGVVLATDAVYAPDEKAADMAWRRMEAKGVVLAPTSEIVAPRPAEVPQRFRTGCAAGERRAS